MEASKLEKERKIKQLLSLERPSKNGASFNIDKKRVGGYDDIIDEVLSEVIGDDWRKYE